MFYQNKVNIASHGRTWSGTNGNKSAVLARLPERDSNFLGKRGSEGGGGSGSEKIGKKHLFTCTWDTFTNMNKNNK